MTLTILGCHSATPRANAHPTAQVLEMRGHLFLIDCGEGTQVQLRRFKLKFSRIRHIFISHLHGDHFYGLIGLVSTFRLLGREADLHIYGPKGIKEAIILQLKLSNSWTDYNLIFHELESDSPEVLFEDENISVTTIPLDHRVYTNGFLFQEKPGERKLDLEAAVAAKIDTAYFRKLKQGFDVENRKGDIIPNKQVTLDPEPPKSYAYCSDTAYYPEIVEQIKGATVLYHEATFLESHQHLAETTKHSTAKEAASIAKRAEVGTLILGHYSGRYSELEAFRKEAMEVFETVELAEDGKSFKF
ncbi:ribonuclease Z [Aureitalea sp. L0-47]|uniref:ribonuclease Z n=1 Tax=Aureitalea sp. L0-47 TaxID=2816962 RepID=UPI0022390577|nr:ribonuclease Z [Aureitalea sp. L0-47]MCW5520786.1 ribonuclease Z [Aureitalea sp. L0-47]